MAQLEKDVVTLCEKAKAAGMIPAVRLNGTSDLPWENLGIIQKFPKVQFYDYTKNAARMMRDSKARSLPNYHLTFSRSEKNWARTRRATGIQRKPPITMTIRMNTPASGPTSTFSESRNR